MADYHKVVYCYSKQYVEICNLPSKIKGRALTVHKLLDSYGLLKELRLEAPSYLTPESLQLFHCKNYITCIQKIQGILTQRGFLDDDDDNDDDNVNLHEFAGLELDDHGLAYDCTPFSRIMDYISLVAGASVKCAELLNKGETKIAVNLFGGWHHAHRDSAAGFCYVNDIVLAILKLKEEFNKILYVDIDIHHGDGVEEAFFATNKVMTVSFHKHEDGYFPGTGKISDIGHGHGKYYSVNVPLKDGINDQQYFDVFSRVMSKIKQSYEPKAVVCQCGADCINGDPLGGFNLTNKGFVNSIKYIADWKLPLLILGGGGYNFVNTAKVWASMIASILEKEIANDIPDHEFFSDYGPFFDLNVTPSIRKSQNSSEYLEGLITTVTGNLKHLDGRSPLKHVQLVGRSIQNKQKHSLLATCTLKEATTLPSHCRKRTYLNGTCDENNIDPSKENGIDSAHKLHKKIRNSIKAKYRTEVNQLVEKNALVKKVFDPKTIFEFTEDY